MAKNKANCKPIVRFDHRSYVFDTLDQAASAIKFFGKLRPVDFKREHEGDEYHFAPREDGSHDIELLTNYEFREPKKEKPAKPLALPTPKRGSIMCICEKSYVSPRTSCPHCGRAFSVSHNRTHGSDRTGGEHLRLE